jgi:hypothetical protein
MEGRISMAGKIKKAIDSIIRQKSKGDGALTHLMHAKLAMKGIDAKKYTQFSEDDPAVLELLQQAAKDFGVTIP